MPHGSSANTRGEIRTQGYKHDFLLKYLLYMEKSLTRRDHPRLLYLLLGALGSPLGIARGLMSPGEFGFFLR